MVDLFVLQNKSRGFTLIELLVASFIFASALAVVYGLFDQAMKSKKDLELTLSLNEEVKNANEVLQTTVREANGDFPDDYEFFQRSEIEMSIKATLLFVSNDFLDPAGSGQQFNDILRYDDAQIYQSSASGEYLYVKNKREGKITIFHLDKDSGQVKMKIWQKQAQGTSVSWSAESDWNSLLNFDKQKTAEFRVNFVSVDNTRQTGKSFYNVQSEIRPMDVWVKMELTAIKEWGNRQYLREMKGVYIPLVVTNPYL